MENKNIKIATSLTLLLYTVLYIINTILIIINNNFNFYITINIIIKLLILCIIPLYFVLFHNRIGKWLYIISSSFLLLKTIIDFNISIVYFAYLIFQILFILFLIFSLIKNNKKVSFILGILLNIFLISRIIFKFIATPFNFNVTTVINIVIVILDYIYITLLTIILNKENK